MYEHPIKRAGLSFNRILYSNTKMVQASFPKSTPQRYSLHFLMKSYRNGKETKRQVFESADMDACMPSSKISHDN